jgi:hypothetical protein
MSSLLFSNVAADQELFCSLPEEAYISRGYVAANEQLGIWPQQ